MAAKNIAPSYLQDLAATQGANQATDYLRVQDEIARQKREMEEEKRKRGSFGQRALRGLGGAVKGGLMGAMTGNPFVAAGGAAAGFAGGALDDGSGQQNVGNTIGQALPLAAMVAGRGASYLQSSPGATPPAAFNGGSGEAALNSYGFDATQIPPAELARLRAQGFPI